MLLHYKKNHKSINSHFEDIVLPDFVVLTGKNGSGKTHLLTGIKEDKFSIDGINPRDVLYLNYLDFAQNFQTRTIRSERAGAWDRFNQNNGGDIVFQLKQHANQLNQYSEILEKSANEADKPILSLTAEELKTTDEGLRTTIVSAIQTARDNIDESISSGQYQGDHSAHSIVETVLRKSKKLPQSISETDFFEIYQKTVFGGSKILSDLSTAFEEYFRNLDRNDRNQRLGKPSLDKASFEKKYGSAPWALIRNIFTGFGLNFDINDPVQEDIDPYDGSFGIIFKNTDRGNKEVDFGDLSSGEQILITLVNAIYTAGHKQVLPKVILLDEIDSPLNPSVIDKFISYLLENFVANGIKVVVATHSPSTVAFAPEDSIFIVNTKEESPLVHSNSNEAINALSEGFITLSDVMNFEKIQQTKIVISEGKNYKYLTKAKEIFAPGDTDLAILSINIGGAAQLRTLFEFTRKFNTSKTFVFTFDCDYFNKEVLDSATGARVKDGAGIQQYEARKLDPIRPTANTNNRFFIFPKNPDSSSSRGIENLFSKATTHDYPGEFDEKTPKNKKGFEKYILNRGISGDFINFKPLFDFIESQNTTNF